MMHRSLSRRIPRWVAVSALALVALGGRVHAAGNDASSLREFDVGDGKVTFDVADATFEQVVSQKIQPKTRVNLIVAPQAKAEKVTLRVLELYWADALQAMAEQISGVLVRKSLNLLRVEKPPLVTIDATDEDINQVIKLIAAGASGGEPINIAISPEVKGRISVTFNKVPWRAALKDVVETAGKFTLVESDYGVLRVVPTTSLELGSDKYQFRYLRPPPRTRVCSTGARRAPPSSSSGTGGGSGGSASVGADIVESDVFVPSDDPSKAAENFPIVAALQSVVAPENGTVHYIPGVNAVLITGTDPKRQAVLNLCRELDVEPPQVFIDMNIIATSNQDVLDFGMQSDSGFQMGFTGAGINHRLPFAAGGATSGWSEAISGSSFPPPSSSTFQYGTLSFGQTSILFKMLKQDGCSKVVQAPKILALDNQEATIFVGESIRYARSNAASNQNGGLTFSVEEDDNSPVNVGFQLLVIPHVIPGENKVMLLVIPQQRALNGTTSSIPGFDRFTVSGQTIDLPRIQSSTLVSHMLLRDKETAVIGGLLEDRETNSQDKLPILGDLPILGALFQGQSRAKIRSNLIITITPRILRGSDAANLTIDDDCRAVRSATRRSSSDSARRARPGRRPSSPRARPPRRCRWALTPSGPVVAIAPLQRGARSSFWGWAGRAGPRVPARRRPSRAGVTGRCRPRTGPDLRSCRRGGFGGRGPTRRFARSGEDERTDEGSP